MSNVKFPAFVPQGGVSRRQDKVNGCQNSDEGQETLRERFSLGVEEKLNFNLSLNLSFED